MSVIGEVINGKMSVSGEERMMANWHSGKLKKEENKNTIGKDKKPRMMSLGGGKEKKMTAIGDVSIRKRKEKREKEESVFK